MSGKRKCITGPNKTEQVKSAWKMLRSAQGDLAKGLYKEAEVEGMQGYDEVISD